jgi:hypothetical protein
LAQKLIMSKIRNIIIFVIILGGVIYAFNSFSKKDTSSNDQLLSVEGGDEGVLAGETVPGSAENVGQGFLDTLLSLRTIKLDRSLLDRDSFKSLRDFTKELIPQNNQGRPNPFAPIGTDIEIAPSASPTPETGASLSAQAISAAGPSDAGTSTVSIETADASAVTRTTATLNGKIFSPSSTTVRSFEWGTNPDALANSTPQVKQTTSGTFISAISGLTPSTTYYFKAVALTGASVSEGDIYMFTTQP